MTMSEAMLSENSIISPIEQQGKVRMSNHTYWYSQISLGSLSVSNFQLKIIHPCKLALYKLKSKSFNKMKPLVFILNIFSYPSFFKKCKNSAK